MAMVTDETPPTSQASPSRIALPDWRRQPHTWFLVGLAAANVAFDGLAGNAVVFGSPNWGRSVAIGVLAAQLFLAGLWMALGGLSAVARLSAISALTLAGAAAFSLAFGNDADQLWDLAIYSEMIVLTTHALLLPLRAMVGWRIDFDPAYHARSSDRSMQLRIVHLLAFTTACAAPLALVRAIDDFNTLRPVLAFGGIALVGSAPVAWIVIAARRSLRFWAAACGTLVVSLAAEYWALDALFGQSELVLLIYLGIVAAVAANLGLLRYFFGLRLFSILGPAAPSAAAIDGLSLDPDLAAIVAAWPRLPLALRKELLQKACFAVDSAARKEDVCQHAVEPLANP